MQTKTTNIILIISLAVNLLIVGAAIGFGLRERGGPRFPSHLTGVIKDIDPELRQEVRQKFREQFLENRRVGRTLHEAMREKQRQLTEAIKSEPFNESEVRAAFAQTRSARAEIEAHMHDQMIAVMGNLNGEQRAQLVQRLLSAGRPPGPGRDLNRGPNIDPKIDPGQRPPPGEPPFDIDRHPDRN